MSRCSEKDGKPTWDRYREYIPSVYDRAKRYCPLALDTRSAMYSVEEAEKVRFVHSIVSRGGSVVTCPICFHWHGR